MSGCEAWALSGRAACTKPLLAAVFIIGYQHFRKYFENIFEKVCKIKKALYICIVKQLKQKQNDNSRKKTSNFKCDL